MKETKHNGTQHIHYSVLSSDYFNFLVQLTEKEVYKDIAIGKKRNLSSLDKRRFLCIRETNLINSLIMKIRFHWNWRVYINICNRATRIYMVYCINLSQYVWISVIKKGIMLILSKFDINWMLNFWKVTKQI